MKNIQKHSVFFMLSGFVFGIVLTVLVVVYFQGGELKGPAAGDLLFNKRASDDAFTVKIWSLKLDGLGATISQPYQVWIESKAGKQELILEADKTDGIHAKWLNNRLVELCYSEAQITKFRNRFVDVDRASREKIAETVEFRLRNVKDAAEC